MQSAYRPAYSTETALVRVTNDLLCAVDKQQTVILVLLDLSAAFDTVDQDILLQRLHEEIGVCGGAGAVDRIVPAWTQTSHHHQQDIILWMWPHIWGTSRVCTGSDPVHVLHQAALSHCTRAWAVTIHVCRRYAVIHCVQACGWGWVSFWAGWGLCRRDEFLDAQEQASDQRFKDWGHDHLFCTQPLKG